VESRIKAVAAVRSSEDFEPLAASFKRISNILKQAGFTPSGPVQPSLLEDGPEADLAAAFDTVRVEVRGAAYEETLLKVASLRPQVDLFFDKVLVNAQDPKVRANRLTLLSALLTEFSTIADFSEIVTSGEQK
jgi:glycyl-tRNA synthetase beta chain